MTGWTPAATPPAVQGWYAVRLYLSERPIVLWWSGHDDKWRAGARVQRVVEYLGPL